MRYPLSKRAAEISQEQWKVISDLLADEPSLYSKLRRLQDSEKAGWNNANRLYGEYRAAAADRDQLKDVTRKLTEEGQRLYTRNRHMRDAATRYAVWGGSAGLTGAGLGLAYSLLNKKQRQNKLRNTLIGLAGGTGLGLLASEVARRKWGEESPFDFKGADLVH